MLNNRLIWKSHYSAVVLIEIRKSSEVLLCGVQLYSFVKYRKEIWIWLKFLKQNGLLEWAIKRFMAHCTLFNTIWRGKKLDETFYKNGEYGNINDSPRRHSTGAEKKGSDKDVQSINRRIKELRNRPATETAGNCPTHMTCQYVLQRIISIFCSTFYIKQKYVIMYDKKSCLRKLLFTACTSCSFQCVCVSICKTTKTYIVYHFLHHSLISNFILAVYCFWHTEYACIISFLTSSSQIKKKPMNLGIDKQKQLTTINKIFFVLII